MAKTKISEFSANPANNTDIDNINIAEGCAPSGINDAIRELMAQLKDFQVGSAGDSFNGPVGTTTAAAGAFTTLAASGAVTLSGGTANGVTYLNGSKVLTSGSALTFDGTTFATSANVGIGNTAAGVNDQVGAVRPLLVSKSDTATTVAGSQAAIVIGNAATTTSNTSQLSFAAITGANTTYFTSAAINCVFGARTNGQYPTGQLVFSTSTSLNSAPTEKMRIDSSGNLGIGTASPTEKLDVTGSVKASEQFLAPAGTLAAPAFAFTGDSNTGIYNQAAGAIGFVCNGVEDFRVDATGQLWNTVNSQVGTDYDTLYKGYLCRAWVNFNGTGTVAIRASGNVSSITDNGTGDYTVNFTTALPDVNYSFVGGGQIDTSAADANRTTLSARRGSGDIAVGSLRVVTGGAGASSAADVLVATVSIFR